MSSNNLKDINRIVLCNLETVVTIPCIGMNSAQPQVESVASVQLCLIPHVYCYQQGTGIGHLVQPGACRHTMSYPA